MTALEAPAVLETPGVLDALEALEALRSARAGIGESPEAAAMPSALGYARGVKANV